MNRIPGEEDATPLIEWNETIQHVAIAAILTAVILFAALSSINYNGSAVDWAMVVGSVCVMSGAIVISIKAASVRNFAAGIGALAIAATLVALIAYRAFFTFHAAQPDYETACGLHIAQTARPSAFRSSFTIPENPDAFGSLR